MLASFELHPGHIVPQMHMSLFVKEYVCVCVCVCVCAARVCVCACVHVHVRMCVMFVSIFGPLVLVCVLTPLPFSLSLLFPSSPHFLFSSFPHLWVSLPQ